MRRVRSTNRGSERTSTQAELPVVYGWLNEVRSKLAAAKQ